MMDIVRLNSDYVPDQLIEGWSSCIWTERYSGNGEFSITTPMIAESRALIPEGSFISLLDSEEVMQVEMHAIEPNDQGGVVNRITGASFPVNFLSERDTPGGPINTDLYPSNWLTNQHYTPAEAVAGLIWGHLVDNTYKFMGPREDANGDPIGGNGDPRLLIPNLEVNITGVGPWEDPEPGVPDPEDPAPPGTRKWALGISNLQQPVFDILAQGKLGIRTLRPMGKPWSNPVRFHEDGDMTWDPVTSGLKLRIDIYQGRDLTSTVTFRYDSGQVENPKYLYAIKGYKNVAHVASPHLDTPLIVTAPGVPTNISGIHRRVLSLGFGKMDELDPDGNFTQDDWRRILSQKTLTELQKYSKVSLFDGEISPLNTIRYGQDYFLGDKVTLQAEYDLEAKMIISEYIRSQDENGETGYPTLSLVED